MTSYSKTPYAESGKVTGKGDLPSEIYSQLPGRPSVALEALRWRIRLRLPFPEPRSIEALRGLALFRGSQAGMAFAESFQILRMTATPETFFE